MVTSRLASPSDYLAPGFGAGHLDATPCYKRITDQTGTPSLRGLLFPDFQRIDRRHVRETNLLATFFGARITGVWCVPPV